jgi:hypothetical protein
MNWWASKNIPEKSFTFPMFQANRLALKELANANTPHIVSAFDTFHKDS